MSRNINRISEVLWPTIRSSHYMFVITFCFLITMEAVASWKLQLCLNGSVYETTSDACKYGFWFTEPLVVHKICFEHGVWAIYKEFCEDAPTIWTARPGSKGCIRHDQLGQRIIGAVPVGQDEYSGAIISTSNRRLFFNNHKLKHGMRVSFLNDPALVEILTWGPPQIKFSLQQYINNDKGILQQCLLKGEHSLFGYYRVHLESSQNASFFLTKNTCYTPLSSQIGEGGRRTQLLPSEIDFDILQSAFEGTDNDVMNCDQYDKIDDLLERDVKNIPGVDGKVLSRSAVHIVEQKVDQETQKIGLWLMGVHFRNDTFDKDFKTWEFLNVAKKIFLTACPEGMVTPFFIQQMHLLFQAVLHESFLQFPNYVDRNEDTTQRILYALQNCLKNATKLEFKTGKNCTEDSPLLKMTLENGTQYLLLVEMPSFIKVDVVNYDLLMESIWKLMNFAHYYCADHFEAFATEHSVLEGHWYRLFSPLVIRRWKYPGKGFLLFQKILMSIDMERSVRNLDFCVSAARLHSTYKGWLKRPVTHWDSEKQIDSTWGKRFGPGSNNNVRLIWDDQAYCITDYMDPGLKLPHGNVIEKCGILLPHVPLRPFQKTYLNRRGNIFVGEK